MAETTHHIIYYSTHLLNKDECTSHIMHSIMTNSVAQKMNFAGRACHKTGISDMEVLNIKVG